jgi:hypothetical protein
MNVEWQRTSFGFECKIGEGALHLIVFYEHGWKVGINDRAVKYTYPDVEAAKLAAIKWAYGKLELFEAELKELERSQNVDKVA